MFWTKRSELFLLKFEKKKKMKWLFQLFIYCGAFSAGHQAKSTSRQIMTQNASKVESLLMSGQKNHFSLTVQLQNIILRRNARRKNNGPWAHLSLPLPISTSVQVVIHSLVTMKCSGMHANTVCCASVHIQKKNWLHKYIYVLHTVVLTFEYWIGKTAEWSLSWFPYQHQHLRWLNPSWT